MNTREELTTGQIAKRYGVPRYQIEYIVESRSIEPARRIGIVRLFSRVSQARIKDALDVINARKARVATT